MYRRRVGIPSGTGRLLVIVILLLASSRPVLFTLLALSVVEGSMLVPRPSRGRRAKFVILNSASGGLATLRENETNPNVEAQSRFYREFRIGAEA